MELKRETSIYGKIVCSYSCCFLFVQFCSKLFPGICLIRNIFVRITKSTRLIKDVYFNKILEKKGKWREKFIGILLSVLYLSSMNVRFVIGLSIYGVCIEIFYICSSSIKPKPVSKVQVLRIEIPLQAGFIVFVVHIITINTNIITVPYRHYHSL